MTVLIVVLAYIAGIAVGAIFRDDMRDLYDDARELLRRTE